MPTDLLTRPPSSPVRRELALGVIAGCVALVVVVIAVAALATPPDRVRGVTISNPTASEVFVEASRPGDDGRNAVGFIPPGATTSFHETIDQGEQWVLHIRRTGAGDGGVTEVTVSRGELLAGYEIPEPAAADGRPG